MPADRLAAIATFVRVVEARSFSAAARLMGTSQPTVSKVVAELERRLGTRLLNRSTRHLSLTEAGATYYERCRSVMAEIEDAEHEVRLGHASLRGTLRVNTSTVLATTLVQPALLAFQADHPGLGIEIVMDDRRIDPVEEGVDLIVRFGRLQDSALVARRAGAVAFGYFAAPGYLARNPAPLDRPEDLGGHDVVALGRHPRDGAGPPRTGGPHRQGWGPGPARGRVTVSSAVLGREAALGGAGVVLLPRLLVADDLARGRLVPVLPGVPDPQADVTLLHPFGTTPPQRVTAFTEFAVRAWRAAGHVTA